MAGIELAAAGSAAGQDQHRESAPTQPPADYACPADVGHRQPAPPSDTPLLPNQLGGGHWRAFLSPDSTTAILGIQRLMQNRNHPPNCYYKIL
jgi:hypothetical protein